MTNDMIIVAYQELKKQIETDFIAFEKMLGFSQIIRKIACYFLVFSAIVGLIFAIIMKKTWYLVILITAGSFIAAVLLCGSVIFLMKPFFWFHRKKAKNLHQLISDKEAEQRTLEMMLFNNNTPDPIPKEKEPLYLRNQNRIRLKAVFQRYQMLIKETVDAKQHLRVCRMNHQKHREWLWFGFALMLLFLALSVIIAIVALYFLFVFLFLTVLVAMIIGWIASQRERYYRPPVPDSYSPNPDCTSVFDVLISATVGKIFSKDDESKAELEKAESNYTRLFEEKEELFHLLKPYAPALQDLNGSQP